MRDLSQLIFPQIDLFPNYNEMFPINEDPIFFVKALLIWLEFYEDGQHFTNNFLGHLRKFVN